MTLIALIYADKAQELIGTRRDSLLFRESMQRAEAAVGAISTGLCILREAARTIRDAMVLALRSIQQVTWLQACFLK